MALKERQLRVDKPRLRKKRPRAVLKAHLDEEDGMLAELQKAG